MEGATVCERSSLSRNEKGRLVAFMVVVAEFAAAVERLLSEILLSSGVFKKAKVGKEEEEAEKEAKIEEEEEEEADPSLFSSSSRKGKASRVGKRFQSKASTNHFCF